MLCTKNFTNSSGSSSGVTKLRIPADLAAFPAHPLLACPLSIIKTSISGDTSFAAIAAVTPASPHLL